MNIAVLAGGISTEREVSIVSGTGVCKALREKGHRAILIDVFCGDERIDITDKEEVFPAQYDVDASAAYMRSMNGSIEAAKASGREFFGPNVLAVCKMADVVFLALHGADGEGGTVQAAFDLFRIPYTGSGPLGSAMAMDKGMARQPFFWWREVEEKPAPPSDIRARPMRVPLLRAFGACGPQRRHAHENVSGAGDVHGGEQVHIVQRQDPEG